MVLLPSERLYAGRTHAYNRPTLVQNSPSGCGWKVEGQSMFERPSIRFGGKEKARTMRKRLQLALMLTATTAIATSFSSLAAPRMWAAESDGSSEAITTTEEHGRKVYVNEAGPTQRAVAVAAPAKRSSLVY